MSGNRWDLAYETMPWERVDTVVFDIGNVLVTYLPERFVEQLFPGDAQKQKDMLERVFLGSYWAMFDRGVMEYEDAAHRLALEFGGNEADYLRAMTGWFELKSPLEEGFRAARLCKAKGKRLILLSNYHETAYHRLRERFAPLFDGLFDGACVSYRCHQNKPEPQIYRTLIGQNGLVPERTLFIDDTQANVIGAMEAGIHGFHMNEAGKMDRFFRP